MIRCFLFTDHIHKNVLSYTRKHVFSSKFRYSSLFIAVIYYYNCIRKGMPCTH